MTGPTSDRTRTPGHRLAGAIAVIIVIGYVVAAVSSVWLEVLLLEHADDAAGGMQGLAGAGIPLLLVTLPVVGAVIVVRRPDHLIGWLMLAAATLIAAGGLGGSMIQFQVTVGSGASALGAFGAWLSSWVWIAFVILGFVLVPLLFPDGRPPSRRWRPAVWGAAVVGVLAVVHLGFSERIVATTWAPDGDVHDQILYDVANPVAIPGLPLEGAAAAVAASVVGALALAVSVAAWVAPIVRFRRGSGRERQQVKWLAFVVGALPVVLLAVLVADNVLGVPSSIAGVLFYVWAASVPVAVGIAILRHGLYEVDRVISRTVAYALVVAVLGAVYAVGVVGLGSAVSALTGEADSDLVVAASVLAVAALFRPVRSRVQRAVERRFNRSGFDARLAVEAFAHRMRDEVDVDAISREVTRAAAQTVQPANVSVWLGAPGTLGSGE